MKRDLAIGIDLGTTQSYMAYVPRDGSDYVRLARCNPNPRSVFEENPIDFAMPSEVFLRQISENGNPVILLEAAKPQDLITDSFTPITRFKLDLGKSREVQQRRKEYRLLGSDQGEVLGYVLPEAITGFMLWRMLQLAREDVSFSTGVVRNITVTVPALSTVTQRKATQFAVLLAGFSGEIYTLEEPIAAFLHHYNRTRGELFHNWKDKFALVFDFGGGTCDLSMVRFNGNQLPNVVGRSSAQVGGEDIDDLVVRLWLERTPKKDRPDFDKLHPQDQFYLRRKARGVKEQLSRYPEAGEVVGSLPVGKKDIGRRSLDRETLSELLSNRAFNSDDASPKPQETTVIRTIKELIDDLLDKTSLSNDKIDAVILAGGSSKLVAVREYLNQRFDRLGKYFISDDVETSIAKGAAVHQLYRHSSDKRFRKLVEPTLPLDFRLYHSYKKAVHDYIGDVTLGEQNEELPIIHPWWNPKFIVDAAPEEGVVKIRLIQGGDKDHPLLSDSIKVKSTGRIILRIQYRITEYGIIEDFKCVAGTLIRPQVMVQDPQQIYTSSTIGESKTYEMQLREYDLNDNVLINRIRDQYGIVPSN